MDKVCEVSIEDRGTTRTITPRGEVDIDSASRIAEPLLTGLGGGYEIVVLDLGQTTFIDSTGVHLAVGATHRAAKLGVRFVVLPGPAEVQRIFELCGLTEFVPFVAETPSLAEAS